MLEEFGFKEQKKENGRSSIKIRWRKLDYNERYSYITSKTFLISEKNNPFSSLFLDLLIYECCTLLVKKSEISWRDYNLCKYKTNKQTNMMLMSG